MSFLHILLFALLGSITAGDPPYLGSWTAGGVENSVTYQNRGTGQFAAPNATSLNFKFLPGGTYERAFLKQSSLYNCSMSVFGYITGKYRVHGDTIELTEETSKMISRDTCRADWNYEKVLPLNEKTVLSWRIEQVNGRANLVMWSAGGKPTYFRAEGR